MAEERPSAFESSWQTFRSWPLWAKVVVGTLVISLGWPILVGILVWRVSRNRYAALIAGGFLAILYYPVLLAASTSDTSTRPPVPEQAAPPVATPPPTPVPTPTPRPDCDPAYPGVCIPPAPPELDCRDIEHRKFEVLPPDPHLFDFDGNGIGCEFTVDDPDPVAPPSAPAQAALPVTTPAPTKAPAPKVTPKPTPKPTSPPVQGEDCHPSYPDVCIAPPPPDLNCPDIPHRNFEVLHNVSDPDPHGFDGDEDGVGCET